MTIVGTGLIGGSLGLALKRARLARSVVGVGHRQATLDQARALGAVDAVSLDAAEGVRDSNLVVLATPIGLFQAMLRQAAPALGPGTVVIDVGSTKAGVVDACEALVPAGCPFVGCHPIAGSEQRGVSHAQADLFEGATCVVTPTARTPPEALDRVIGTWEGVGMTVRCLPPETHDRLLAQVSHLPHVAASALVQAVSPEAEMLVGPGWADTTRVASGDAALWRDILMSNAQEVAGAIERFQAALEPLRAALRDGNAARVQALLAEAKARRDALVARRAGRPPE